MVKVTMDENVNVVN